MERNTSGLAYPASQPQSSFLLGLHLISTYPTEYLSPLQNLSPPISLQQTYTSPSRHVLFFSLICLAHSPKLGWQLKYIVNCLDTTLSASIYRRNRYHPRGPRILKSLFGKAIRKNWYKLRQVCTLAPLKLIQ
jgi:hypothetical protein